MQKIVNSVISSLENERIPWIKPWKNVSPQNLDGRKYSGINYISLLSNEHSDPRYGTFNSIKSKGGMVNQGAKGTMIVYRETRTKTNDNGEDSVFSFGKASYVFNIQDTDLIVTGKFPVLEEFIQNQKIETIPTCESVWENMKNPPMLQKGDRAMYTPMFDLVTMPDKSRFKDSVSYYQTFFHELSHSTAAEKRINRTIICDKDTESYALEELIAEMSACMMLQHCGCEPHIENSTNYCRNWIEILNKNPKYVIKAAAESQKIINYFFGKQEEETPQSE